MKEKLIGLAVISAFAIPVIAAFDNSHYIAPCITNCVM